MRGIREIEIEKEINRLSGWYELATSPRVMDLIARIREENQTRVLELKAELEAVKAGRKVKARWPENTPESILQFCKEYWSGSTEHNRFRIHCWNDRAVWTSYPAGVWSDNSGQHRGQAGFYLLSLTEKQYGQARALLRLSGRFSLKQLQTDLDRMEQGLPFLTPEIEKEREAIAKAKTLARLDTSSCNTYWQF